MRSREALLRPYLVIPVVPKRRLGMRPAKRRFAPCIVKTIVIPESPPTADGDSDGNDKDFPLRAFYGIIRK